MGSGDILAHQIARAYNIPLQLASFFSLLILYDCVTCARVYEALGTVEGRQLAHRLRNYLKERMPDATVHSRRMVGYWLDDATRAKLVEKFHVVLAAAA